MKTHVEFRSDRFPAYEGEEEQINPGRFGKRVAEFLAAELPAFGFEVEKLVAEDWGWIVPIKNDDFTLWIGCGNYYQYRDGFLCFIRTETPVARKFFRKLNTLQRVESLQKAIDAVLNGNPDVRDVKWWSDEEFNNPRK